MRNLVRLVVGTVLLWGCTAKETVVEGTDFKFDGTCVNCHAGLTAGHVHTNYKLRCIDCHGGNDQVDVPEDAFENFDLANGAGGFRDPDLMEQAHVLPKPGLARYFYANGVDDDGDGVIDEFTDFDNAAQTISDLGEQFEPGLHGEGAGEFMDAELNRDLNYTRFLNPGDLRVATLSCGSRSRGAFDGGGNGLCHQETIDIVRRSIMVNQAAVTNGAYYGNESWDPTFQAQRDKNGKAEDPRFGAFGYALDYDGDPDCMKPPPDPDDPRSQPFFDSACLERRAASEDPAVAANAQGNVGNPAFEIAQGTIKGDPELLDSGLTKRTEGAGDSRWAGWGGQPATGDAHVELAPLLNRDLPGPLTGVVPDPVDNILRTFRAYYPLNYPASTTNFNFTFGTSILPNIARYRTANAYGRGHSSGCTACHTPYNYAGNREPQRLRNDDGTFAEVDDPTTKHREFDPANDEGPVDVGGGTIQNRLIGRPVGRDEVLNSFGVARGAFDLDGDGQKDGEQQKTYSKNHTTTTKIDTDTCGLCHGFVTRINYAYQGAAEDEQRDVLARRGPIEFTTPNGTEVRILDSWVREDNDVNNDGVKDAVPTIVKGEGVAVVARARERDADLLKEGCGPNQRFPECGLAAGAGGCAQNTFSEDCNNNGELDTSVVLERRDLDGNVIASVTINEDANGNGKLDLIDRIPRENAIDGRQVRYIYGGRNGSTKQMDVHFERGMHCIDCHFMQDVHGDGNVYSTNWDAIEIECEDCHGANARTNFKTSGPNGGNDLRLPVNENLEPFFEELNGQVIQRSRVNTGVFWVVPQTVDAAQGNPYAAEAHNPDYHIADPGAGSTFVGEQGQSELTRAKVECATCHNGWVTNCVGCHTDINVGDQQRNKINLNAGVPSVEKSAGENEIWVSNAHNKGHINFQLLTLLRSPFTMGVGPNTEKGRLSLFRSSMQATVSVSDGNGDQLRDSLGFTTFQNIDGNSGRMNAATSGVAMNMTMAHTVRPDESRGCELCHSLVDTQGRTRNEHILSQSYGVGTGSITFLGDWVMAAGLNGLELFDYKDEKELVNQINPLTVNQRFPGHIINAANVAADAGDRRAAAVEPAIDGRTANDVVLIRNFNATPPLGQTTPPTLRDFAFLAVNNAGTGEIVVADISARGHPSAARPAAGNTDLVRVVSLGAGVIPVALAHMAPDVSDPFIYAAVGTAGLRIIRMNDAELVAGLIQQPDIVGSINVGGRNTTEVALAGDLLYVGTAEGDIIAFTIGGDGTTLTMQGTFSVGAGNRVNEIQIAGFAMYVATQQGLTLLSLDDPGTPARPAGAAGGMFVPGTAQARSVAISEGHAIVATANGVFDVDARTIADPKPAVSIVPNGQTVNAVDVVVSQMPGQRWIIALETTGDIVGIKLDGRLARAERCYPDPGAADCLLELEMYDPTRSSRDPSFDPLTGTFDTGLLAGRPLDPSAGNFFRMAGNILGSGTRMVRPVTWETLNTLSGRRYRDSFMPGSGTISLGVMQNMRNILVCEVDPQNHEGSSNPSGLGELGYADENGNCEPFAAAQKRGRRQEKVCKPGILGPGLRKVVCAPDVRTATPTKPVPRAPLAPVKSAALVPNKR